MQMWWRNHNVPICCIYFHKHLVLIRNMCFSEVDSWGCGAHLHRPMLLLYPSLACYVGLISGAQDVKLTLSWHGNIAIRVSVTSFPVIEWTNWKANKNNPKNATSSLEVIICLFCKVVWSESVNWIEITEDKITQWNRQWGKNRKKHNLHFNMMQLKCVFLKKCWDVMHCVIIVMFGFCITWHSYVSYLIPFQWESPLFVVPLF